LNQPASPPNPTAPRGLARRHPLLLTVAAVLLLTAAGIALFVATFDLNRYRAEVEVTLSRALGRPVRLGEARFSLRHGPAFAFAGVRLGDGEGEAGILHADHLYLRLEWLPLLQGRVTLSRVVLDGPRYTLILSPAAPGTPPAAPPSPLPPELLRGSLIRSLKVHNGTFQLIDRRLPQRPLTLALERIEAAASNLAVDRPTRIAVSATLIQEGSTSPVALAGEIAPPAGQGRWRDVRVRLEATAESLAPGPLLERYLPATVPLGASGRLSMRARLDGSPAAGLQVDTELAGRELSIIAGGVYRQTIPLQRLTLRGTWTWAEDRQRLDGIALAVDEVSLAGECTLERRTEGYWLAGRLTGGRAPLASLLRFFPEPGGPTAAGWLKERLTGGVVELGAARIDGPLAGFRRLDAGFPLREAVLTVREATLRLDRLGLVQNLSFAAHLDEDALSVTDGSLRLFESPLRFSGRLLHPFRLQPEIALSASGSLPARALFDLTPEQWRQKAEVDGMIPAALTLKGTRERLLVDLRADLTPLALRPARGPAKLAGRPGELFLTGEITPRRFALHHGRLQIPPLELRASGGLDRQGEEGFQLAVQSEPLELATARPHFPILDQLRVRGEVAVQFELAGAGETVTRRQGTAYLRGCGLHLGGVVADLSEISGQMRLAPDLVEFDRVSVRLGSSPVSVSGRLRDFAAPRLELQVSGRTIRAGELIFPSPQALFRDLDARLVIDREGLLFDPVTTRLDDGTQVVVKGSVRGYQSPRTVLDIEASRANIDDVIALWHREEGAKEKPADEAAKAEKKEGDGKGTVRITARVKEGVLGPLHFQNAEGEITHADGILTIHPLRFSSGQGTCTGRVVLDRGTDGRSRLRISGHLESFDAEALHHELLRRRGLITGTLRGDFYLEGEPGKFFLPTSLGGFSLEVKNGVLRQFTWLSKVFSLLNVSQILAFRLPDMAVEGMPFKRLQGNVSLHQGVLSTEDLFVDSNAMNLSLVGTSDLVSHKLDLLLGVKPLRTVDKIVTQIPIAGWLLTGGEKALITAHFAIRGKADDPDVTPVPITSISEKVLGIFKRVLELPEKVITDPGGLLPGGRGDER
jgi:uncharacterized protein YhdP